MQTNQVTVEWEIKKKTVPIPTLSNNTFQYTGSTVIPSWGSFSSTEITVGGTASATTPGAYTATFTPKGNWCWADGSTDTKSIEWTIQAETLVIPTQKDSLTYSGSAQSPTWNNYDSTKLTLGGDTSKTEAGTYTATFTPKSGCMWEDGTTTAKSVSWTIGKAVIAVVPSQSGTLTYSGSAQSPAWNSYNTAQLTLGGTTSGTNAGSYNATFTPKANYQWSDGTTAAKTVSWSIGRLAVVIPSQSGSLTYSGSAQSPSWNNYNSTQLTLGGTTSGTNAGSYSASFTPKSNWCWSGGSTEAKSVSWSIGKATATISISPTTLSFSALGASSAKTITVTSESTGTVTATSSATSKATVSVSGKTVTVTPVADGTATITISIAGDSNYTAPSGSKTCSVTVATIYTGPSKNATAAQFQEVIKAGKGPSTFAVGDLVGIPISGNLAISSGTAVNLSGSYYAPILGFNHNSPTEGSGNYVDLQFLTSADGATPLCFCPASGGYQMNTTNTNIGGPGASLMYTTTLPKLLGFIDSAWKNTFIEATKYVDTTGNNNNVAANIKALKSILFLLAEFEVFGAHTYANQYEKDKQKQYDLYKNGATKIRKSHADGTTAKAWWESSPGCNYEDFFCSVGISGAANFNGAYYTYGLAPGFRIG